MNDRPTTDGLPLAGLFVRLNVLALYAIGVVLAGGFALQFTRGELPCPLCLLQRIALVAMAAGLIMNLRFGLRPRYYGMVLLAAACGGIFAVRQILLHIAPGDPGYGAPVFDYHYYTWAAIVFAVAILATATALLIDRQFERPARVQPLGVAAKGAIALAFAVTVLNVATTFLECGVAECPDNPVEYLLLSPG